ncbi:MAG: F0F1 ATP synthase subunit gamma [Candidatus Riflebacteria bacterium]|nr:F0F1 ATP synthase subunit gamma [Candidatus Riflebacteria bacterium]
MIQTIDGIQRQIKSVNSLKSIVRTMKTLAAVSIGPYERAVQSLTDYFRSIEMGWIALLKNYDPGLLNLLSEETPGGTGVVVFGSDQGMVGAFNDNLVNYVVRHISEYPEKRIIWPIGERVHLLLSDLGFPLEDAINTPDSVDAIPNLMSQLLCEIEEKRETGKISSVVLFYNRTDLKYGFESVREKLIPLEKKWIASLTNEAWPTKMIPQFIGGERPMISALIREYLFVEIFKACAKSAASEHATRLAAMQRAEKKIDDLSEELRAAFNQKRQSTIMEELFDLISGFEVLSGKVPCKKT